MLWTEIWADGAFGGSGGIRTHGTRWGRGLANLCHWPLGDTSSFLIIREIEKKSEPAITE